MPIFAEDASELVEGNADASGETDVADASVLFSVGF